MATETAITYFVCDLCGAKDLANSPLSDFIEINPIGCGESRVPFTQHFCGKCWTETMTISRSLKKLHLKIKFRHD